MEPHEERVIAEKNTTQKAWAYSAGWWADVAMHWLVSMTAALILMRISSWLATVGF
jgi:hypothetical protein